MKRAHKSDRRSLWSAVAWNRFGSHLQILQTQGTSDAVGLLSIIAGVSKWTTKAVPSNRTPKFARASNCQQGYWIKSYACAKSRKNK
jgi:hypothetical protein